MNRIPAMVALFASLITPHCIGEVTNAVYEAEYRDSGSKIRREDAWELLRPAIYNRLRRCSGEYLDPLVFTTYPCRSGLETDRTCANYKFVDRQSVTICRIFLDLTPCDNRGLFCLTAVFGYGSPQ